MARKLSPAAFEYAKALIASGETLTFAAHVVDFGADHLSKRLRADGVVIPRGGRPAPNRINNLPESDIAQAYVGGESELSLSKRFSAARGVIRRILRQSGITPRSGSDAMYIRMSKLDADQRRALIADGRRVRFANMTKAAYDPTSSNPAIGVGERDLAQALELRGYPVTRQHPSEGYFIDIGLGHLAVEIKLKAAFGVSAASKRSVHIIESGKHLIIIRLMDVEAMTRHLDQVVASLDIAYRNPAPRGEYWVIECGFKRTKAGGHLDHFAVIKRPPQLPAAA